MAEQTIRTGSSGNLIVARVCHITGLPYEVEIPHAAWKLWKNGQFIQIAMPHLSADQREFLLNNLTPREYAFYFKLDEDDS